MNFVNLLVYAAAVLLSIHCVNEAIKMEKDTNRFRVYSYLLFFGSIMGIAMWVYYFDASISLVLFMAGITAIIFTDRRRTRKADIRESKAAYD